MTHEEKLSQIERIVKEFATALYASRKWQIEQMLLAATVPYATDDMLIKSGEAQEWLYMAKAAIGLIDRNEETAGYVQEICQGLAEWLFSIPGGTYSYNIPENWSDTPMGALWWSALLWVQGDGLATIAEAAKAEGVTIQAISNRIDRGTLKSFTDPLASTRQGKRLVRLSDLADRVR